MKKIGPILCDGVLIAAICLSALSARAGDEPKHIVPKCSAQIDPDDNKLILMVCDFSAISVAELVVDATADIVITDNSGTSLESQTLHFADKKNPMRGGKKYARSFEYASASKYTAGVKVKISSAQAVVVPEVSAIRR
jgi:hypothetical protein